MAELERIRRSLRGRRPRGVIVAGAAGAGKTRLVTEAAMGPGAGGRTVVRVAGTAAGSAIRFGAFAHLLPAERDIPLLTAARAAVARTSMAGPASITGTGNDSLVLIVDDAHLLDPASAALLHHLGMHTPVRLAVTVCSGEPAPDAVTALWKDDVLPRLELAPLPERDMADALTGALGGPVDALTVRRLYRITRGNLTYLRELVAGGSLTEIDGVWTCAGAPRLTGRLRELIEARIGDLDEDEYRALELIALGEPLDVRAVTGLVTTETLERLEARGLISCERYGQVLRPAHPLYGEVVRARCGPLRAHRLRRRLAESADDTGPMVRAVEWGRLAARVLGGDLDRAEALVNDAERRLDDEATPADIVALCAHRAMTHRLRGHLRDALAWARAGALRIGADTMTGPGHAVPGGAIRYAGLCLGELATAAALMGETGTARRALARAEELGVATGTARAWALASGGDLGGAVAAALDTAAEAMLAGRAEVELFALHDVVRLGAGDQAASRLAELADGIGGPLASVLARHAGAWASTEPAALEAVAERFEQFGMLLHAAEAYAHAGRAHRRQGDPRRARSTAACAWALARTCRPARTPALADLVAPQLTGRQREIAHLAAAGLTNREIAERLTVSIRTVANHLCGVYERLGVNDRLGLGALLTRLEAET